MHRGGEGNGSCEGEGLGVGLGLSKASPESVYPLPSKREIRPRIHSVSLPLLVSMYPLENQYRLCTCVCVLASSPGFAAARAIITL